MGCYRLLQKHDMDAGRVCGPPAPSVQSANPTIASLARSSIDCCALLHAIANNSTALPPGSRANSSSCLLPSDARSRCAELLLRLEFAASASFSYELELGVQFGG
ncbi:hypothetical protein M758_6G170700 [Ceratodon purpureus]|nr:hypothetical protein M758_6G170700 [Ceratodon purpureus]